MLRQMFEKILSFLHVSKQISASVLGEETNCNLFYNHSPRLQRSHAITTLSQDSLVDHSLPSQSTKQLTGDGCCIL